jgi:nucleotide-binding universal stress UspA family protein
LDFLLAAGAGRRPNPSTPPATHSNAQSLTHASTRPPQQSETDSDSIGQVLVKKAQVENAVALVVASHNKGKLKELFTGSVTKYVVANLRTPVVVVPA